MTEIETLKAEISRLQEQSRADHIALNVAESERDSAQEQSKADREAREKAEKRIVALDRSIEEAILCVGEEGICHGYKHRDTRPCFKHRKAIIAALRQSQARVREVESWLPSDSAIGHIDRLTLEVAALKAERKTMDTLLSEANADNSRMRADLARLKEQSNAHRDAQMRAESRASSLEGRLEAAMRVVQMAREYTREREYQNVEACRKDQNRLADNLEKAVVDFDETGGRKP